MFIGFYYKDPDQKIYVTTIASHDGNMLNNIKILHTIWEPKQCDMINRCIVCYS